MPRCGETPGLPLSLNEGGHHILACRHTMHATPPRLGAVNRHVCLPRRGLRSILDALALDLDELNKRVAEMAKGMKVGQGRQQVPRAAPQRSSF